MMRLLAPLTLLSMAAPAAAQPIASPVPEAVDVAIYRAEYRSPEQGLDADYPGGFAFITETRTVAIPQGRSTIRFEGVASGILPESAIIAGLPEGVREKNLDADLLSPGSLYGRSYGRPVTVRRVRNGKAVYEPAIIRSGEQGAMILETREGFYVADCVAGEKETLLYESVPEGLSPRPTLSIEVDSPAARQVQLQLSYIAWGFDWEATYVATMRPDGEGADLFAWITLASSDVTSFTDAETMVIAGQVGRDEDSGGRSVVPRGSELRPRCHFRPVLRRESYGIVDAISAEDIGAFPDRSVTEALQRISGVAINRFAEMEELGDLKLYRVPHRTTVAANGQKQVALLAREKVTVDVVYRARVFGDRTDPVVRTLRAQNNKEAGLGVALPAGRVSVFEPHGDERLLVGEGAIVDKATNEEVEIDIAGATQVASTVTAVPGRKGRRWADYTLTVANPLPHAIRFEAEFLAHYGFRYTRFSQKPGRKNGRDLWAVEVPAGGSLTLRYRHHHRPPPKAKPRPAEDEEDEGFEDEQ